MLDGFILARFITDFLFGFSTLFSIINPFGIAFMFRDATAGATPEERSRVAFLVARNCFIVLIVSLFLGARVLAFFGISIEALRIAGGIAVAAAAWKALSIEPAPAAAPRAGVSAASMAFFPLTVPLTTGPGSIAAAIALGASNPPPGTGMLALAIVSQLLMTVAVAALIWVAYHYADSIARRLGEQGTLIITKLSAFLLLCVGVQIMLTGVMSAARQLLPAG